VDGRKPWEIIFWESSVGKERDGSDHKVDGGETVGNSLGRAPLRRSGSEMEATRRWTEGKPWEIAWDELCGEGARWKRRHCGQGGNRGKSLEESSVGKEGDGSDDIGWTGGNLGRARL